MPIKYSARNATMPAAVSAPVGNGVAAIVVSAWERELDRPKMAAVLKTA